MSAFDISRRSFLKGAAIGAVGMGASAAGLAGCASPKSRTDLATEPSEKALSSSGLMELNPQDYDYTSNSITDWGSTKLFSEWKFGGLTLHHRMVKSAAGSAYLPWWTTEMSIAEYGHWAQGGVELIWIEDYASLLEHYPAAYKMRSRDDCEIERIVEAVHSEGGYCGYQLSLMGASFSGFDATTAPQFECAQAHHLTLEEVHTVQADFIDAAEFLKERGVDAVEINAAGNNIGQAFLSRNRNMRSDGYGPQNFENRTRFVREIIEGIKGACGEDFPVQVLINAVEENDYNLGQNAALTTVEENIEMAKLFEKSGADSLHLRLGPFNNHPAEFASDMYFSGYGINGTTGYGNLFDFSRHFQGKLIANHSGCGMLLDVAAEVKEAVSIPVGCVTYMDPAHAPDMFESALVENKADFYLMNRPFMVDPEYVNKLREGRIDEIRPCNRCLHCHFDLDDDGRFYEHCRMNVCHMRAFTEQMPEGPDLPAGDGAKSVMVIGGGPAGMEAARVAALRNYSVTLYEKGGSLGGLLDFAAIAKGPHENLERDIAYFKRQMELTGVRVVTGKEVDAVFVRQEDPDVVIVATGGLRDTLGLAGTEKTNVVPLEDFLSESVGDNVVIVGGNAQAVDVALHLIADGKRVTMVSPFPLEKLARGQSDHIKGFVLPMLYTRGARVWPNAMVKSIGEGEVVISCDAGTDIAIPCDTVVEGMDMLPNMSLAEELSDMSVYAIGDCVRPFNIAEAIASGNLTARKI